MRLQANLGAGFDTYGINKFKQSGNIGDIFDGLFLTRSSFARHLLLVLRMDSFKYFARQGTTLPIPILRVCTRRTRIYA